jgi:NAD(P)-dependent dehydrogenase (short-subunit alcohol dehydrogenase family)
VDINEQGAKEVAEGIVASGGSAESLGCDVADTAALREVMSHVDKEHGRLHVLYNHAGINGFAGLDATSDEWDEIVGVNLKSGYYGTSFALPLLRKAEGKGSIIFTASVSGIVGSPRSPLYSMTKGGVVMLMKALALRLGPESIRSNAICPGLIDTPMFAEFLTTRPTASNEDPRQQQASIVPLRRVAAASEVAAAAAFLASDDASWVTGTALPVDGGYLAQ